MDLAKIQSILVVMAAAITILGIPMLLLLVHRFHRAQSRSLEPFIFTDAHSLIASVRKSHEEIRTQLEHQLHIKHKIREQTIAAIGYRKCQLKKAKGTLERIYAIHMKYLVQFRKKKSKDDNLLNRMHARHNAKKCELMIALVDKLLRLEHELEEKIQSASNVKHILKGQHSND
jgi:hypothetical protein